jgi:hypothetical protein
MAHLRTIAGDFPEAHQHDSVREALDAIYSQESSRLDETLAHMQWASLPKEDW